MSGHPGSKDGKYLLKKGNRNQMKPNRHKQKLEEINKAITKIKEIRKL